MKQLKIGQHFGESLKTLQLEGTILTEAGYMPNIEVPWHYHENAYFFYHLRGHLDEVNKKQTLTCKPGTLLFHHWQDPHYDTNFSSDARFFHIEIENAWFSKHHLSPAILEGSMVLNNPALKSIFHKIFRELKHNDVMTQLSIDGLLSQAFALVVRQLLNKKPGQPSWIKKVKEILNDAEIHEITLRKLSDETGLHPVHLSKEFPKYFSMNFGEYLRSIRMGKAMKLLNDPKLKITEIAFLCGFSDQSHFIRSFRDLTGTTPLKYRKSIFRD